MSDKYKINHPEGIYFMTLTVIDWIDVFIRKEYSDIFLSAVRHYQKNRGLVVYAYVIMSSHVHLIASAPKEENLAEIIRDLKKYTSVQIVKTIQAMNESRSEWMLHKFEWAGKFTNRVKNYKFWQDGNQAKECFSAAFLKQKIDYIHNNPVVSGIVGEPWHFVYSSAGDYAGKKGLIEVEVLAL